MTVDDLIVLLLRKRANKDQTVIVLTTVTEHCQGADETYEVRRNIASVDRDDNTIIVKL